MNENIYKQIENKTKNNIILKKQINYYIELDIEKHFNNPIIRFYVNVTKKNTNYFTFYSCIYLLLFTYSLSFNQINILTMIQFFLSYLLTDFISGIVHLYLDNSNIKFDYSLTDYYRTGFEIHHTFPTWQWLIDPEYKPQYEMLTLFVPMLFLLYINILSFNSIFITFITLFSLLMQYFHYSAHAFIHGKKIPTIIRFLQKYNVIISPETHRIHHIYFDRNYTILNGWTNFIFNKFTINNKDKIELFIKKLDDMIDL